MRELDLSEMESIEGGDCDNLGTSSVALSGIAWAVGALVVTTTFGLGIWIVAGVAVGMGAYSCTS
jgi:type IV secretory pathway TrbD component